MEFTYVESVGMILSKNIHSNMDKLKLADIAGERTWECDVYKDNLEYEVTLGWSVFVKDNSLEVRGLALSKITPSNLHFPIRTPRGLAPSFDLSRKEIRKILISIW